MKRSKTQQKLGTMSKQSGNDFKNKKNIQISERKFMSNVIGKAKDFIKNKSKDIKKSASKILRDLKKEYAGGKTRTNFLPGKMLAMNYRAKDVTQKYDANPLIICLGPVQNPKLSKTHFIGLNMHWLPMKDRVAVASFFSELNEKRNGKLTYKDVQPFIQKFKGSPVIRMYIIANVGQKVIEMPSDVFLTAAAIPSEKWMGA